MKAWPMVPLGEVLQHKVDRYPVNADQTYPTFGVYGFGRGLFHKPSISGATVKAQHLYRVRNGQFVYSRLKAFEGAYALVTEEFDGHYVSNEFPTFDCLPNRLLPTFVAAYFRSSSTWKYAAQLSTGVGARRERIQQEQLLSLLIPLPSINEQRRLVTLFDTLAAQIEEAQLLQQESKALAKSFVSSLHLKMSGNERHMLGEVLVSDEDRTEILEGHIYPQVGVRGFGGGLFARETLDASQTTYKSFNRLYDGAVVLSQVKGWEGAIAVCPPQLVGRFVSPEYRTFRCLSGKASSEYLSAVFATPWFWTQLKRLTRGVGARRERIRPEAFLAIDIPMPSLSKQEEALELIRKITSVSRIHDAMDAEFDALMPATLNQAFQGQLS
jgi:type I restriction enzyme, S subunit